MFHVMSTGDGIITFEDFVLAFRQSRKEELAKADHERQANLRQTFQVTGSYDARTDSLKVFKVFVFFLLFNMHCKPFPLGTAQSTSCFICFADLRPPELRYHQPQGHLERYAESGKGHDAGGE